MSKESKIIAIIGGLFVLAFIAVFFFVSKSPSTTQSQEPVDQSILLKDDLPQTHKGAQVTLVEFGDFQCPACGAVHPLVKQMLDGYGDKVNFVFRHYPLSQHPNALPAANAVEAAGAQGKFWEMYNKVYESQSEWSTANNVLEIFNGYAKDLGLDVNKFSDEVKNQKYKERIDKDRNDGLTLGVDATPTFYINGVKVSNFEDLKKIIDQKLTETEKK